MERGKGNVGGLRNLPHGRRATVLTQAFYRLEDGRLLELVEALPAHICSMFGFQEQNNTNVVCSASNLNVISGRAYCCTQAKRPTPGTPTLVSLLQSAAPA